MNQRIEPTLVLPADDEGAPDSELFTHRLPERREPDEDPRRMVWFVTVVAGTAIGGLIAYFAVRWYEARPVEAALSPYQRTVAEARHPAAAGAERASASGEFVRRL